MKFTMTAACMPHSFDTWFPHFAEGEEFEAKDFDEAQDWLDEQCRQAGTDQDRWYMNNGPAAKEVESETENTDERDTGNRVG